MHITRPVFFNFKGKTMYHSIRIILAGLLYLTLNIAQADLLSDANKIFIWAESSYSEHFSPPGQSTTITEGWRYRYYQDTKNYIGIK